MAAFQIISKYFWLFALLYGSIHVFIARKRADKAASADPQLSQEYSKLVRAYFWVMNAPWIVMGIGSTIGGVPTMWHFFRPQDGNPFVLAWYVSIISLWIITSFWLFFKSGAETLIKYSAVLNLKSIQSPGAIKLIWVLSLICGIMGMVFIWLGNVPLPASR